MSDLPKLGETDDQYPITVLVKVRRWILEQPDWRDYVKDAAGEAIDNLPEPHLT